MLKKVESQKLIENDFAKSWFANNIVCNIFFGSCWKYMGCLVFSLYLRLAWCWFWKKIERTKLAEAFSHLVSCTTADVRSRGCCFMVGAFGGGYPSDTLLRYYLLFDCDWCDEKRRTMGKRLPKIVLKMWIWDFMNNLIILLKICFRNLKIVQLN